jgi:hypothetical protein
MEGAERLERALQVVRDSAVRVMELFVIFVVLTCMIVVAGVARIFGFGPEVPASAREDEEETERTEKA